MLEIVHNQLSNKFVLTSISSWIPVSAQKTGSLVKITLKIRHHLIKINYRGGRSYKFISINFKKTQSMKNNVPSEVTDFRVLHANHAISTAGDPLRAIGFGVHLDCAERSNGSQRKQRKSREE
jgi:hypothetical protein